VQEELAHDREVGQAGAGEHDARQPERRSAQPGIGERHGAQRVVREEDVGLQAPARL